MEYKVAQYIQKLAQKMTTDPFKIAQKVANIWATFVTKFVTNFFRKSPNLVTLDVQ